MLKSVTQFIRTYRTESLIIALAFTVSVFFTFENRHYGGDLMMSRLITVERLVDAGTWAHSSPTDSTPFALSIDRIKIGDSFYSSKPPLYPLIMAGEVYLIKKITGMAFYLHKKTYIRITYPFESGFTLFPHADLRALVDDRAECFPFNPTDYVALP